MPAVCVMMLASWASESTEPLAAFLDGVLNQTSSSASRASSCVQEGRMSEEVRLEKGQGARVGEGRERDAP